jgi:tetratricopeptide (TPR) repeat protein
MKKLVFKITFLLSALVFAGPLSAQDDSKYGDDPDQCKRDLSEYIEFVKQKSYLDAVPAWRRVYKSCPESSKSIYINGPTIYKALIKKEKDVAKKKLYLDTIMQIYDKRIEYFGQKGSVLGRKGNDLLKYDESAYEEAYAYMSESVKLSGSKSQAAVLQNLMNASAMMYKDKKIDAGQVVQDFSTVSDNLAISIENEKDSEDLEKLKTVEENIGILFISTGAGSCDVLIDHFTPKFEAAPKDEDLLKTITKYLDKGDCTDSKLFFDASVNLYEVSPSSQAAYNIAKMAAIKKDFSKAAEFYKKAIEMEEDDAVKAQYYYELAAVSTSSKSTSRTYALKAAALKPAWGAPYILIGKLYAASSSECGDNKFDQSAVFWLAVDVFNKAKAIDASVAEDANKLIATYKVYFPGKEDAFAHNVTDGAVVEIGCWINETTKARF